MVEVANNHSCLLGEGPVWDQKTGTICWVDIINGDIHELNPVTGFFKTINVNSMVGAIAICKNGDFLAALKEGLAIVKRATGEFNLFSKPESHLPGNRFNDGKCDPEGRFWVGTMSVDESPDAGSLYVLDIDHQVSKKIGHTTISNGMAWSLDHQTFYYIDTPTLKVAAYDYEKSSGSITNPRTVIIIDEKDGHPDGMTIDTEGMLWIAHWGGWQLTRWNPSTGEKLFSIPLPAANVTSCTFGGENLQDLYITTAKKGLNEEELAQQPLAGNLFVFKNSGYNGLQAFEYRN